MCAYVWVQDWVGTRWVVLNVIYVHALHFVFIYEALHMQYTSRFLVEDGLNTDYGLNATNNVKSMVMLK